MSALTDLIARLEAGADRELDVDIEWAVNRSRARGEYNRTKLGLPTPLEDLPEDLPEGLGRAGVRTHCPAYTSSVDAALKLFPPDRYYLLGAGMTRPMFGAVIYADTQGDEILGQGESNASLPLAICIAALKARAAQVPA